MKKLFFICLMLVAIFKVQAQRGIQADAKAFIDTTIVTNGTNNITATKMRTALNKILTYALDSVYFSGDTLVFTRGTQTFKKKLPGGFLLASEGRIHISTSWNGTDSVVNISLDTAGLVTSGGNLQQATDAGNTTTNNIIVNTNNGYSAVNSVSNFATVSNNITPGVGGEVYIGNEAGQQMVISKDKITLHDSLFIITNKTAFDTGRYKPFAISSTGSLVKLSYWPVGTGGSGWGTSGTTATAGSSFIGPINNVSFRVRVNNTERLVVDSAANIQYHFTGTQNESFQLSERKISLGYPVATYRPFTTNKPIAFDIMPNGTPSLVSNNGVAWIDVCDKDVQGSNTEVASARIGMYPWKAVIGSASFSGHAKVPLDLVSNRNLVIRLDTLNNTIFGDTITVPSAVVAVKSTTQGFLPPAMTGGQKIAISSPAEGLMLYDKDQHKLSYYNSSAWIDIGPGTGAQWSLTGNASVDSSLNFIGPTDSAAFIIKTGSFRSGYVGSRMNNTSLGRGALASFNGAGNDNSAFGKGSLSSNTSGTGNTAIGSLSMGSNTTGASNFAGGYGALSFNTTGNNNVAIGTQAGLSITTGSNNIILGALAKGSTTGNNNVALGYASLYANTTGSGNIAIGYQQLFTGTMSNKLSIGNNNASSLIYGDISTGQIKINNTTNSEVHPNLALEIISQSKGLRLPVLTSAQISAIVATSLYDITGSGGTGYTNGTALVFTGGGGSGAAGTINVTAGAVTGVTITSWGIGYTSAPTVSSTGGTGATFTAAYGIPTGTTVYCSDCTANDSSTGVQQTWNGSAWKNNW